MKKVIAVLVPLLFFSLAAYAQNDHPKFELTGGYQLLHIDTKGATGLDSNYHGWTAEGTAYVNRWFGITANFAGNYDTQNILGVDVKTRDYQFLFGPTLKYRRERFEPYVHALFGVNRVSGAVSGLGSGTDNGFGMALGGGVDVPVSQHFAVRVANFDYFLVHQGSPAENFNNFRFSAGLQVRF